jgi:hypothetical protein
VGTDLSLRYGAPVGVFARVGAHFGSLSIEQVRDPYRLAGLFVEPGFIASRISPRWAPFISGRVDVTREAVEGTRASFTASGYSVGGGGGAVVRLLPWVVVEGGVTVGAVTFSDYVFQGDQVSYRCMETVDDSTSLPESASRCGGIIGPQPQYNCYPPFHDRLSGDCVPPKIAREHSARAAIWYRTWIGVHVSLTALADVSH